MEFIDSLRRPLGNELMWRLGSIDLQSLRHLLKQVPGKGTDHQVLSEQATTVAV